MDILNEIQIVALMDKKNIHERVTKMTEEVGELARAVGAFSQMPGCKHRSATSWDMAEEVADTIICAASVGISAGLTPGAIEDAIAIKLSKWRRITADENP